MPPLDQQSQFPALSTGESDVPVHRDRVMHGAYSWNSHFLKLEQAIAETLIVVQDVIVPAVGFKVVDNSAPKCIWLGETARQHAEPFKQVSVRPKVPPAQGCDVVG